MFRSALFLVLVTLGPACSLMPPQSEHIRARQMEEAVVPMAATALETGQLETARRLYRRLLVIDADSVEARMGLGDVALREQEAEAAARWYFSALARAEQSVERHAALLAHGRAALAAGQIEAARDSFTQLADAEENASRASAAWGHNGVGLTLLLEGDLRGGVAALEQAVLRAPEEERFRGNLDRALAILRDVPATGASADISGATRGPPAADRVEPNPSPVTPATDSPPPTETIVEFPVRDDMDRPPAVITVPDEPESLASEFENPQVEHADAGEEIETALPVDSADGPMVQETEPPTSREGALVSTDIEAPPEVGPPPPAQPHLPELPVAGIANSRARAYVVTENDLHFLQFGAFSERANAENLVSALRSLTDQGVQITDADPDAEFGLHRVRVGPISSEQVLWETMAMFEASGYTMANPPQSAVQGASEIGVDGSSIDTLLDREDGEQYLQAGAFSERSTAETIAGRLRELTELPVQISEIDRVDEPPLHRVRVGPIGSDEPLIEWLKPEE